MDDPIEAFWVEFLASNAKGAAEADGATYTSWHFGTEGAMADELAELVVHGEKRATTGALWSYEEREEALPAPGEFNIVTDGAGRPTCVIRTTSVEVVPFSAVGKARILNQAAGFVKIVAEKKYDEVLGVHIIGPAATELIAEAGAAMKLETTSEELVRTIHAHPTLSEAVGEAAHAVLGGTLNF